MPANIRFFGGGFAAAPFLRNIMRCPVFETLGVGNPTHTSRVEANHRRLQAGNKSLFPKPEKKNSGMLINKIIN